MTRLSSFKVRTRLNRLSRGWGPDLSPGSHHPAGKVIEAHVYDRVRLDRTAAAEDDENRPRK
jgi:hypothetical protein